MRILFESGLYSSADSIWDFTVAISSNLDQQTCLPHPVFIYNALLRRFFVFICELGHIHWLLREISGTRLLTGVYLIPPSYKSKYSIKDSRLLPRIHVCTLQTLENL